ncbi:ProQ/FINO family protein [Candidatus Sororendozoicomonas aggregata]|uniref:ProQ/FINO family protein n=1 Tax=Candidatus Sororendozoicomonas aggregata TaxID=3073239 RepID=UPI002ED625FD
MTEKNPKTSLPAIHVPDEAKVLLEKLASKPEDDVMNAEALRVVRAIWPKAFHVSAPQPLKIGIHKDMENAGVVPAHIISKALHFFTTLDRYLETIKPKATRIDLKGQPAGQVRLREAVDAEIKLFSLDTTRQSPQRTRVVVKKMRLLAVNKAP